MTHLAEHKKEMRRRTEQAEAACALRGRHDRPAHTSSSSQNRYLLKSLDTTQPSAYPG